MRPVMNVPGAPRHQRPRVVTQHQLAICLIDRYACHGSKRKIEEACIPILGTSDEAQAIGTESDRLDIVVVPKWYPNHLARRPIPNPRKSIFSNTGQQPLTG